MQSEIGPARFWLVLGFSFTCGLAFFLLAALLVLQTFAGNGSQPGNILRLGMALLSLFLGCFFFVLGTLYRASSNGDRDRQITSRS